MGSIRLFTCISLAFAFSSFAFAGSESPEPRFIQVEAHDKFERSAIAATGMSIEAVRSDSVWGFATETEISQLEKQGFHVLGNFPLEIGRGGHAGIYDYPADDGAFHNYSRLLADLQSLQELHSDAFKVVSIGKSVEGKDLLAIHINTNTNELASGQSTKPGAIFMGGHHAREHLSVEIPFKLAKYLMDNRRSPVISKLLDSRDIWIIPMVNPDGAEFDIATGKYAYWRKNRRDNQDGTFGVDLNRNYGFHWGTGGSSKVTGSQTYRGPSEFSEPETQAIRDFVRSHTNTKVLLTFHTFSELILYPWGHTHDDITNKQDLAVFKKMAQTMSKWNHYKPEASSDLYTTSGDTVDWAYGELGIFAFTFEMSPSKWAGSKGFYPGVKMIDRAFNDNLQPCLYLLNVAGDPYSVVNGGASRWLMKYSDTDSLLSSEIN
jgi:carboxypeptidase T